MGPRSCVVSNRSWADPPGHACCGRLAPDLVKFLKELQQMVPQPLIDCADAVAKQQHVLQPPGVTAAAVLVLGFGAFGRDVCPTQTEFCFTTQHLLRGGGVGGGV